tara:strand:- start:1894 stop:2709 length:816 start_codon:yes stop_codon:yes gene_type:complete
MNSVGIMQGRLSPQIAAMSQVFPYESWREEFVRARRLGFDTIEWLYDSYRETCNPILTRDGRDEIRSLSREHEISVDSVCAHAFIDGSLISGESSPLRSLSSLIDAACELEIKRIILPFLETSSVTDIRQWDFVFGRLGEFDERLRANEIFLLLETDADARILGEVFALQSNGTTRICYDVGNRTADGAGVVDEILSLGSLISEIHIKDRPYDGPNVDLGLGDVDFDGVFRLCSMSEVPLILETKVGGNWEAAARANIDFVREHMERKPIR